MNNYSNNNNNSNGELNNDELEFDSEPFTCDSQFNG